MYLALAGTLLASFSFHTAFGQERWQAPAQFTHTSFTADQGAPQVINGLAQTSDGLLWMGTETGLVRFDGVRFERYESPRFTSLPFSNVSALLATPDGGLWIGYRTEGASFLHGETITSYSER